MKWGVLQYCVIRPITTLAAVILDYAGYYCEASWSPIYAHIWIVIIISISVTIAMYCLIQLYMPVAEELKPHRPILKLFSVKAVVFLTFWQATLLAGLSMLGVVKGVSRFPFRDLFSSHRNLQTRYMTAEDINIGIGAILECFEMMYAGRIPSLLFVLTAGAIGSSRSSISRPSPTYRTAPFTTPIPKTWRPHVHHDSAHLVMPSTSARPSGKYGSELYTCWIRCEAGNPGTTLERGAMHIMKKPLDKLDPRSTKLLVARMAKHQQGMGPRGAATRNRHRPRRLRSVRKWRWTFQAKGSGWGLGMIMGMVWAISGGRGATPYLCRLRRNSRCAATPLVSPGLLFPWVFTT